MDWYYAVGQERRGPVDDEGFQRLMQTGDVTPLTLVWRQGMDDWQPYSEVAPVAATPSTLTIPVPLAHQNSPGNVICAGCGRDFPPGEVILLETRPYCIVCKPIAIQRLKEGVTPASEAEKVRNQYLKHEAAVRSVGLLYYVGGVTLMVLGGVGIIRLVTRAITGTALMSGVFLVLGIAQFATATGLRGLKPWAKIPTVILSIIGLTRFPVGTLINAYILYLVLSTKGKMVFSREYQAIVAQTPHIKYRTSILIWILFALVLLAIGAAFTIPFFARFSRN